VTSLRYVIPVPWRSTFEWDDRKSERNLRERGFDFEAAKGIFDDEVLEQIDDRHDYGEMRIAAIGQIAGRFLVVIHTWRENRRRIISARPAKEKERNDYRKAYPE
jgi:uncharacterized protein